MREKKLSIVLIVALIVGLVVGVVTLTGHFSWIVNFVFCAATAYATFSILYQFQEYHSHVIIFSGMVLGVVAVQMYIRSVGTLGRLAFEQWAVEKHFPAIFLGVMIGFFASLVLLAFEMIPEDDDEDEEI